MSGALLVRTEGAVRILVNSNPAARNAIKPLFAADGGKMRAQAIKYCRPATRRQIKRAGLVLGGIEN